MIEFVREYPIQTYLVACLALMLALVNWGRWRG